MKQFFLYLMALFYVIAGINHFISTPWYLNIMPPYIPFQLTAIYFTGICEIVLGLLTLPLKTRRTAAILIIVLLIMIFPANIQMAINYHRENNPLLWVAIVRLPLQLVLIWWAWIYVRNDSATKFAPDGSDSKN